MHTVIFLSLLIGNNSNTNRNSHPDPDNNITIVFTSNGKCNPNSNGIART